MKPMTRPDRLLARSKSPVKQVRGFQHNFEQEPFACRTRTKKVDVRLVAATNRDLERIIADREFRSDLYYRLNVFPIRIPPLRERREDIPLLARYFVQKFARQMQKQIETIPATALKALTDSDWPGNIRKMANFLGAPK
jgi:formate hydrogenlyase transcriptional activator